MEQDKLPPTKKTVRLLKRRLLRAARNYADHTFLMQQGRRSRNEQKKLIVAVYEAATKYAKKETQVQNRPKKDRLRELYRDRTPSCTFNEPKFSFQPYKIK